MCAFTALLLWLTITGATAHADSNAEEKRLEFLRAGLQGKLKLPEEKAQFHLNLCQPQKAWQSANDIKDEKIRGIFQASILSLVTTVRPPAETKEEKTGTKTSKQVAARFKLDVDEVWADELIDLNLIEGCEFPLAAETARANLREQSRGLFETYLDQNSTFSALALATDVGFRPKLETQRIESLAKTFGQSPYLTRLKYFSDSDQNERNTSTSFQIQGQRAVVSALTFSRADLEPHRLERPWLLDH